MTYEAVEESHQLAWPVELYAFTRSAVVIGRYTSHDENQTAAGYTYLAWPGGIKRSAFSITNETGRGSLNLTVARDFPIAALVHDRPRTGVIGVVVYRRHNIDPDNTLVTAWAGRVLTAKRERNGARTLICEPRAVTYTRNGLTRKCGRTCQHVLYGPRCRLTKASWAHATTISSVTGRTLVVGSVHAGWPYTGGIVERVDGSGITDVAYVVEATGTTLTLDLPLYGAAASDAITLYPGCDWTMDTCNGVFANAANYGGRLHIPTKNPFTESAFD